MKQLLELKPSTRPNTSSSSRTVSGEGTLVKGNINSAEEFDERLSVSQGGMSHIPSCPAGTADRHTSNLIANLKACSLLSSAGLR